MISPLLEQFSNCQEVTAPEGVAEGEGLAKWEGRGWQEHGRRARVNLIHPIILHGSCLV